jgi:hypothetical protein
VILARGEAEVKPALYSNRMVVRWRGAVLVLGLAVLPAAAQDDSLSLTRYEAQYGVPVDISMNELAQLPSSYDGRAVRTRALLLTASTGGQRTYYLQDSFNARLYVQPFSEMAGAWDADGPKLLGAEVEFTGVFHWSGREGFGSNTVLGTLQFWQYLEMGRDTGRKTPPAPVVSLEDLVTHPGRYEGKYVTAVGQFRGRNLFGDLPSSSEVRHADWVIKDDLFAVWVTGKKPKGDGWQLDSGMKRDAGHWIQVVGRVAVRDGVVYLQAGKVEQGRAPTPTAAAEPPKPAPARPKVPPVVVFQLPLDGETDVPSQSRFVVQFSKDMDESSFKGRVLLRYAGGIRPGDRGFDGATLSYDGGRRALTVDPGDLLRPGRRLELLLLPGIVDVDGLPLVSRRGQPAGVAVDVLHYTIGG